MHSLPQACSFDQNYCISKSSPNLKQGIIIWGPFYGFIGLTLIPAWISYMNYKVWEEITYLFPNFNVDLSLKVFCGIHQSAISQEVFMKLIHNMCSEIIFLISPSHLAGLKINELKSDPCSLWFTAYSAVPL